MARLLGINSSGANSPSDFQLFVLGRSTPFYANSDNPFHTTQVFVNTPVSDVAKSGNDVTITVPTYTNALLPVGATITLTEDENNTGVFTVKSKTNTTIVFENPLGVVDASPALRLTHNPFIGAYAVKCIESGSATISQKNTVGAAHTTEAMEAGDIEFYEHLTSFVPSTGKFKLFLL